MHNTISKHSYILWVGSIFDQETVMQSKAISPAANNWQSGLIKNLNENGCQIVTLGHTPEPLWPKGKLKMKYSNNKYYQSTNSFVTNYLNIPFLRSNILISKYQILLKKIIKLYGLPKLTISYNAYPQNSIVALRLQKDFGIPWVCLVADMPTTKRELYKYNTYLSKCDGLIFLSWYMYQNSSSLSKLHMDGGVENLNTPPNNSISIKNSDNQILLYAGSLTKWGGVNLLIDAFKLIAKPNVKLWICGPGPNNIKEKIKSNKNIKYLGFVTKKELKNICGKASIFVNPRPSHIEGNEYNFPSKLFEYMTYLKPIISTETPGISPEYKDVLNICEDESAENMAAEIEAVLNWDEHKTLQYRKNLHKFVLGNKTWPAQTERLHNWILTNFNLDIYS